MKRMLPWLAPLVLAPMIAGGLLLWRGQGALIWLSDFLAACF